MAAPYNTTTVLPATSSQGDAMDESLVAVGIKRTRVVLGGETDRNVIVEPLARGSNYAVPVISSPSATGTTSSVASSATVVTLLAANSARLGATIYNESTQVLYVKCGSSASATDYTVPLIGSTNPGEAAYYEVPYGYTGILTGIWASANGNARITEFT